MIPARCFRLETSGHNDSRLNDESSEVCCACNGALVYEPASYMKTTSSIKAPFSYHRSIRFNPTCSSSVGAGLWNAQVLQEAPKHFVGTATTAAKDRCRQGDLNCRRSSRMETDA